MSGAEDSQVTEFVRSLTYGGDENVPTARKFPVSCKFSTVIELGMMVRESRGSGAAVRVTVTVAVLDTMLPSEFVNTAVMVSLPALKPFARPVELIETMDGLLEVHLIWAELVTSCWRPVLPDVPSAMNWAV
jgi:hypothetical protein